MSRSATSATSAPSQSPGASWQQQQRRRAVVLAVTTDAAVTALLVLLGTALAGGMTGMTGWRREAALLISVLVAVPLLARQVWRGRRALAAPEIKSQPAVPAITAAQRAEPASSLQLPAADRHDPSRTAEVLGRPDRVPENGTGAPANGFGDRRTVSGGNLPEEIGVSLIGLARREVRADSAAVLVPDAGSWLVISDADHPDTGGTLRIAAHQMMRVVLYAQSPSIVRGSDRIPGDLAGLPLPASDHVLAVPLGRAGSVMLLSRARPPFHQEEPALLSRVLDAQGTMLDLALKMRKLGEDLDGAFEWPAGPTGR
jgi:hypothetical protein